MVSDNEPVEETNKLTSQSKATKIYKNIFDLFFLFWKIILVLIFSVASSVKSTAASPILNCTN